ncbi:MAG: hypothetical protein GY696_20965 [Gammaproteobacteria bacterium]|nr:hypothetical protein [Gammaproteobacteria bacterium]
MSDPIDFIFPRCKIPDGNLATDAVEESLRYQSSYKVSLLAINHAKQQKSLCTPLHIHH